MIQELKKKDGTSTFKVKVYIEGRQVTKTFRRKKDAQLWQQQIVVDRERGVLKPTNHEAAKTFAEFSREWFTTKVSGKSPKTISAYRTQLKHHLYLSSVRLNSKTSRLLTLIRC